MWTASFSPDGRDGAADILTLLPNSCSGHRGNLVKDLLGQPKAEAERDDQARKVEVEKRGNR